MEKVKKLNIDRKGKVVYIGSDGDIYQLRPKKKIMEANIVRESGYLYFVDKEGDVSRPPMKR